MDCLKGSWRAWRNQTHPCRSDNDVRCETVVDQLDEILVRMPSGDNEELFDTSERVRSLSNFSGGGLRHNFFPTPSGQS